MFDELKQQPLITKLKDRYMIYRNLSIKIIKFANNMYFSKEIIKAPIKVWNLIYKLLNNNSYKNM